MTKANSNFTVTRVSWMTHMSELRAIRETVFIKEQSVPKEEEWDGQDEASWHYLAKADDNETRDARPEDSKFHSTGNSGKLNPRS